MGQHAGRRRLAVRSGDGDEPLRRAQFGQEFAPVHDSLAALAGDRKLRVVGSNRRRDDDVRVRRHRRGVVPDAGLEPGCPEVIHIRPLGAVGARDRSAQPPADEGESAHAGATDGDEVKLSIAPVRRRGHEPEASRTSAAIRFAASGRASDREAAAIAARRGSSARSAPTTRASSAGSSASSSITVAAPASAIHAAFAC